MFSVSLPFDIYVYVYTWTLHIWSVVVMMMSGLVAYFSRLPYALLRSNGSAKSFPIEVKSKESVL